MSHKCRISLGKIFEALVLSVLTSFYSALAIALASSFLELSLMIDEDDEDFLLLKNLQLSSNL